MKKSLSVFIFAVLASCASLRAGSWFSLNGTALSTTPPLGVVYGGTGQDLSAVTVGAIPYFSGTGTVGTLAAGTSGYVLKANGAGAPSWVAQSAIAAGSVAAANVAAGSLGASVMASSVAANSVGPTALSAGTYSNVTLPAANVAAGSLGSGVIVSSVAYHTNANLGTATFSVLRIPPTDITISSPTAHLGDMAITATGLVYVSTDTKAVIASWQRVGAQ